MQTHFFIGKGGVGKTTLAAAFAVGLASEHVNTLIVSLDPAHNLGDALKRDVFGKIVKIDDFLNATEIDTDRLIERYLTETSNKLKNTYKYLSVMNIDRYFDILKNSPGIEEYAILQAIEDLFKTDYEAIVFDTPPTGITLRVFSMPRISVVWTNSLIDMRRRILSKRKMVANVKGPIVDEIEGEKVEIPTEEETDPVMQELFAYKKDMIELIEKFSSENNFVNVVTMAEELAFSESKRINDALKENNMKLRKIYLNKYLKLAEVPEELKGKVDEQERVVKRMGVEFKGIDIREVPLLRESPQGSSALMDIYKEYMV